VIVTRTALPDVLVIEPKVFGDARGFFLESWNAKAFAEAGVPAAFVQDNHSRSPRGVLRGLHYQIRQPQGKLVRVAAGEVFDVAVDLRRGSPTFGRWVGERCRRQQANVWIPPGFGTLRALGTATSLQDDRLLRPEHERVIAWNDPDLAIAGARGHADALRPGRSRAALPRR
jgi:dTDP-4-dehydrorhamnose 3,5-epimerase